MVFSTVGGGGGWRLLTILCFFNCMLLVSGGFRSAISSDILVSPPSTSAMNMFLSLMLRFLNSSTAFDLIIGSLLDSFLYNSSVLIIS